MTHQNIYNLTMSDMIYTWNTNYTLEKADRFIPIGWIGIADCYVLWNVWQDFNFQNLKLGTD